MNFVDEIFFGEFCKEDFFDHLHKTIFFFFTFNKINDQIHKQNMYTLQWIFNR